MCFQKAPACQVFPGFALHSSRTVQWHLRATPSDSYHGNARVESVERAHRSLQNT